MRRTTIAMFSMLLACDDPPPGDDAPSTAEPELGTTTDVGTGESTAASSDESSGAETTEDVRLDVPAPQEFGCQKVDFLFVIDNSGSMSDEQDRLIAGFPGFIADIEEAIERYDYHMMVVTTNAQDVPEATECDEALGAGRVVAADGTDCGLLDPDAPQRFADAEEEDDDDLASVFACVAEVGLEGGGTEQPIWSMARAITAHSGPGGCNEGFLRDDAILVVTVISDEEDEGDSPGDPPLWKEVMLSAKHGDPKAIVMLGLLGDTDLPDGVCEPFDGNGAGAEGAPRLRKFVEAFPHGSWDSVCLPDYAPFFNKAVADIGEACTEFVPPG